jgi:hypothetical protein
MKMYGALLAAVCGVPAVCFSTSASATYGYCVAFQSGMPDRVTPVFHYPDREGYFDINAEFGRFVQRRTGQDLYTVCNGTESEAEAVDYQSRHMSSFQARRTLPAELIEGFPESLEGQREVGSASQSSSKPKAASKAAEHVETAAAPAGATAAEVAAERHKAVEERNRAAQAQYEADLAEHERKVTEFKRLTEEMERRKAQQQAEMQHIMDRYKADQAAHAEQMSQYQQEVNDYQNKLALQGSKGSATGGRRQATSAIVDSREAAMAGLMKLPVGPLSDIQCDQITMYSPPKWSCWGFYLSDTKPTAASAQ